MSGYTKLFGSILQSTVWLETPPVKVVWITMLAMADRDGIVEASLPGLARSAGVDRLETEQAIALFLAPDPDSRTKEYEGRRIEIVPGGWRLLNHETYRRRASAEEAREKATERKRRQRTRDSHAKSQGTVTGVTFTGRPPIADPPPPSDPRTTEPPLPPSRGGNVSRVVPFTKKEIRAAEKWRDRYFKSYGRVCPHDPACEGDRKRCLRLIASRLRADADELRAAGPVADAERVHG